MSEQTIFLRYIEEADWATQRMIEYLIEKPSCIEGIPEKKEAYSMALEYFKRKQEKSKSGKETSVARADAIKLETLLDAYAEAPNNSKQEYAKQLVGYIIHHGEYWLKLIPDNLKEEAFQIVIKYLEELASS